MADREDPGRSRRHGARGLAAALRREARAGRPAFSPALHDGVLAAVAATSRRRSTPPAGRHRPAWSAATVGGLAACAAVAIAVVPLRLAPPPWGSTADVAREPAAVADGPGIERLPTPAEIGEGVLAEVTTLAAAAVGLPEWTDLAVLDPVLPVPADDPAR